MVKSATIVVLFWTYYYLKVHRHPLGPRLIRNFQVKENKIELLVYKKINTTKVELSICVLKITSVIQLFKSQIHFYSIPQNIINLFPP